MRESARASRGGTTDHAQRSNARDPAPGAPASARSWAAEDRSAQLERALVSNRRIGIAIGILVARLLLTDVQALELLRDASQRRNVKLREPAEDVICSGSV